MYCKQSFRLHNSPNAHTMFQVNQYVDNMSGDEEDAGDNLYDFRKDGGENTATRTDTITDDLVLPNRDPPADPPVLGTDSTNEPPPPVENASIASSTTGTANEKQERKKGKKLLVPKYTWTVEGTDALIEEWKIRPLLFDCSHKEYHMKDRRRIAVESIQRKLSSEYEIVPLPPVEEIVKKMNNNCIQ